MLDRARKYLSIILQIFVRDFSARCQSSRLHHLGGRLHPARALRLVHHRNDVGSHANTSSTLKVAVVNEDKGADSNYTGKIKHRSGSGR